MNMIVGGMLGGNPLGGTIKHSPGTSLSQFMLKYAFSTLVKPENGFEPMLVSVRVGLRRQDLMTGVSHLQKQGAIDGLHSR